MESPRDQEHISTLTLVQRLLWWPKNSIRQSAKFVFLLYLSNGDESGEKDHRNEFRGSKNGGKELWGGLKWPEMAGKLQKSGDKTVQPPSGSPARSRRVLGWLAVKFHDRHRPMVAHLMVQRV